MRSQDFPVGVALAQKPVDLASKLPARHTAGRTRPRSHLSADGRNHEPGGSQPPYWLARAWRNSPEVPA